MYEYCSTCGSICRLDSDNCAGCAAIAEQDRAVETELEAYTQWEIGARWDAILGQAIIAGEMDYQTERGNWHARLDERFGLEADTPFYPF